MQKKETHQGCLKPEASLTANACGRIVAGSQRCFEKKKQQNYSTVSPGELTQVKRVFLLTVYLTVILQFSIVQLYSIFLHLKTVHASICGNICITVLFYFVLYSAVAFYTNSIIVYSDY